MIGAIVINNNFKEESHFSMEKRKIPSVKKARFTTRKIS